MEKLFVIKKGKHMHPNDNIPEVISSYDDFNQGVLYQHKTWQDFIDKTNIVKILTKHVRIDNSGFTDEIEGLFNAADEIKKQLKGEKNEKETNW